LKLDQNTFIAWSTNLVERGFNKFYLDWSDYFPGYLYILWLLGKLRGFLPNEILYKLPAIFSDILSGFLMYKIAKKHVDEKKSLIVSSLFLFNPAVFSNSSLWGQVDSIVILFSLLSLYSFERSKFLSAIFLALGTLVKPQTAFLLPVFLYLIFKSKNKIPDCCKFVLTGLLVFVLGFIPFSISNTSFFNFVLDRFLISANQYPYTSVNAFNFWGIFGFWKPDAEFFPLSILGILIFVLMSLIPFLKKKTSEGEKYIFSALLFLNSFMFLTRTHERHLLPALALVCLTMIFIPNSLIVYVLLSLSYVANMAYSYVWITYDYQELFPRFLILAFILVNLFALCLFIREIISSKKINFLNLITTFWNKIKKSRDGGGEYFTRSKLGKKRSRIFLFLILLFSLVTRLYQLNKPENEYFDEVYHVFTARQMLHGNKAAWEWWNTPPEGFAYEWTHPPLAKLFMWGSMFLFEESSFFWRLPGALFGVGVIFLTYLIAKKLFKDETLAIFSAFFLALDGLTLTMSRIGMNDTYLLFFSLLTIYYFLEKKDFLSSVSYGLALSSKWSALWVVPILFLIFLARKKRNFWKLLWFFIIPPVVYLISYLPMFLNGHSLEIFWGMQKQMWWYHTRLKATHPYTSPWWSWPLDIRPVYLFTTNEVRGMVSRIYNLGNPIVFWFGLVSLLSSFLLSFLNKNKTLALVVFSYLIFFIPWSASPRIMFFYHYLPSVPFLAISTGYILRKENRLVLPVFILSFLFFLYFYPHWSGLQIPIWLDKSYYWFTSWR